MGYLGNENTVTGTQNSKRIVVQATPNQTISTVTGGYNIGQLDVFRNGVKLARADDYNADKSEIGYSYVIDTRDDYIDTTSGWTFSFGQDVAGLLGDSEYIRSTTGGKYYYEIAQNWVLNVGANAGYVYNYSNKIYL